MKTHLIHTPSKRAGRGSAPGETASKGEPPLRRLTRRAWISVAIGSAVVALGGERWWRWANPGTIDVDTTPILVYASPSCSCCHAWMNHLEANGFRVSKELVIDVTPLKRKYGVPQSLWSCHTAIVEGYTVEGHVPADVIQKVLAARPTFAGLAVAGMPNGSPGMEGAIKDNYDVMSFTRTGEMDVYAAQ